MLTCHYSDVGSASDWLKFSLNHLEALTQICVVTRHQYGISALVPQTSFYRETSGGLIKRQLFSQDMAEVHKQKWKWPTILNVLVFV